MVPYLREAYHGEPYVTRFLVREAFEAKNFETAIPASLLRERLPEALRLAEQRARELYDETSAEAFQQIRDNYVAFVEHCERVEEMTGEPAIVVADF